MLPSEVIPPGGGVLPYISDIGMCGPKGYDWVDYRREFKEVLKCFSKQNQVRTVRVWAQLHKKNLRLRGNFCNYFLCSGGFLRTVIVTFCRFVHNSVKESPPQYREWLHYHSSRTTKADVTREPGGHSLIWSIWDLPLGRVWFLASLS